jgi:hypothetical protein
MDDVDSDDSEAEIAEIAVRAVKRPAKKSRALTKTEIQLLREADGRERDGHPQLQTVAARVDHVVELLALRRWTRATAAELVADWEISPSEVKRLQAEAQRRLEAYGEKDAVLQLIQERCTRWVLEGDRDRVKAAELLLKTVGALTERHEVTHALADMTDDQVAERAISQLVADSRTRAMLRAALAEHDTRHGGDVQIVGMEPLLSSGSFETELEGD